MASQLHIYFGNVTVTSGMRDGTEASSGTELSPISVTLDASRSESKAVKCAVRCDTGYYIEGNTTITKIGTNADKWKVAADDSYTDAADALANATWLDTISLANVDSYNVIFWVKAMSDSTESPQNDTSVDLQAEGLVVAEA